MLNRCCLIFCCPNSGVETSLHSILCNSNFGAYTLVNICWLFFPTEVVSKYLASGWWIGFTLFFLHVFCPILFLFFSSLCDIARFFSVFILLYIKVSIWHRRMRTLILFCGLFPAVHSRRCAAAFPSFSKGGAGVVYIKYWNMNIRILHRRMKKETEEANVL